MKVKRILCLMVVLVCACQNTPQRPSDLTDCQGARPQVCTLIYKPVCAMEKDGQFRTYSSDCAACSHEEVIGYKLGVCVKDKKKLN